MISTLLSRLLLSIAAAVLIFAPQFGGMPAARAQSGSTGSAPQATTRLSLPVVSYDTLPPGEQLCRLGVGGTPQIASYPIRPLRLGWYLDWGVTSQPPRPFGIGYLPMVRVNQQGLDGYITTPSIAELPALVAKQRGAVWVIGNEPDRPAWQDDILPALYARAYHDVYQAIKQADPTARVAIAGVVQPTPLRLQYLDMVLQAYETSYGKQPDGTSMPIDVWTIHAFILNEKSCVAFPKECWGAGIPPGISATQGEAYTIEDHGRLDIFKGFITTFRNWMAQRGYRDRPLLLTEFGILMPADYGFDPATVQAYMQGTFDFLATANGPSGYPADENRLVQGWAWYSLDEMQLNGSPSNGTLFSASTRQRTVFGDKFVALASNMQGDVNLRPLTASATRLGSGSDARVVLSVTVANSGNSALPAPVNARFYRGNPAAGGTPIATEPWIYSLDGCGATTTMSSTWIGAPGTTEELWAVVDPMNAVMERNESDNRVAFTLQGG